MEEDDDDDFVSDSHGLSKFTLFCQIIAVFDVPDFTGS